MTSFQDVGLTVKVSAPLVTGGGWLHDLAAQVEGYAHTISAWGGFDTASFGLVGKTIDIEDWLERGLGRHVEVWDSDLMEVWEGYVDQVSVVQGSLTYTVGPLTELANRVLAVYDALNTGYSPPTQEGRALTTLVQNLDSQARYGKWEKTVSAGKTSVATAGYVRDTFLAERAWPPRTQSGGSQGGGSSSASISLKGYHGWLTAYPYTQTASSGTTSAAALMQAVLAADPNAIFSTDYSRLSANAMLVPAYENDDTYADSKLQETVALGDVSGNRWTFGLYEGRRAVYAQAPTALAYAQSMQGSDQSVYTAAGTRMRPWRVRPAQWIFMDDFLVGKPLGTDLKTDLRCAFLEQVRFQAPYDLTWSGGRLGLLDQVLAQITLGGIR